MSPTATSQVSTSVEDLAKLVTLSEQPSSVVWRRRILGAANSAVPGPTDWQLEALLTFDEEQARGIIEKAKQVESPRDIGSLESVDWLPADARQHFRPSAGDGKYKPVGEIYSASSFSKSPLSAGYLVRLGQTPSFFLVLHTQ